MSKYLGVKHCVALNSGTDALTFAMHSLGIKRGDEVITPPIHLLHLQQQLFI